MKRFHIAGLVFVFCMAFPVGLVAQEVHGGEHGRHKNHIAFFLGTTQAELHHGERDDPQFTLGFDYERRLNNHVGVGGLLDVVLEGHREAIIAAPLFLHAGSLKGLIGPGGERIRETGDWEFVMRFGILWEFGVSPSMTLAPVVQYDVTKEGGTWILGLGIGKGL